MDEQERLALRQLADAWLRQMGVARARATAMMAELASHFRIVVGAVHGRAHVLKPSAVPPDVKAVIAEHAQAAVDAIDRLRVCFQFHDRVHQVLSHPAENIRALRDELTVKCAGPDDAGATGAQRLQASYTTPEERNAGDPDRLDNLTCF